MREKIFFLVLGIIVGLFMMFITSNIIDFHGANSRDVKNSVIVKDDKLYHFVPNVIKMKK